MNYDEVQIVSSLRPKPSIHRYLTGTSIRIMCSEPGGLFTLLDFFQKRWNLLLIGGNGASIQKTGSISRERGGSILTVQIRVAIRWNTAFSTSTTTTRMSGIMV